MTDLTELLEAFSIIINAKKKSDLSESISNIINPETDNETIQTSDLVEPDLDTPQVVEETTCFTKLTNIKESEEIQELIFEDNTSLNIDSICANFILSLYEELDNSNKIILEKMVNATDKSFLKILEIAVNKE